VYHTCQAVWFADVPALGQACHAVERNEM
jgi:hypothetical protein